MPGDAKPDYANLAIFAIQSIKVWSQHGTDIRNRTDARLQGRSSIKMTGRSFYWSIVGLMTVSAILGLLQDRTAGAIPSFYGGAAAFGGLALWLGLMLWLGWRAGRRPA